MNELSDAQIKRQDFVDNSIYELILLLSPADAQINWNIEMIADVRDEIRYWLVNHYAVISEQEFYPYLEE